VNGASFSLKYSMYITIHDSGIYTANGIKQSWFWKLSGSARIFRQSLI